MKRKQSERKGQRDRLALLSFIVLFSSFKVDEALFNMLYTVYGCSGVSIYGKAVNYH